MGRALLMTLVLLVIPASASALPVTFAADEIPAGNAPRSLAVADFNGDGDPDVAIANEFDGDGSTPGTVTVLAGGAGGSFSLAEVFDAGAQPRAIVAGLFNAGDDPDLAVANFAGDNITVAPGATGATFGATATYTAGDGPRALATGLFNTGSDPDLVTANELSDTASVLLGDTGATFDTQVPYTAGGSPSGVAVADFNADGDPDLAVANLQDDDVSIFTGAAAGTFNAKVDRQAGDAPRAVVAGDFNGDGDPDLAIPDENADQVSVLVGGENATFPDLTSFPVGDAPRAIAAVDLTRDGDLDLVTANFQSNDISVLVGGLGASFGPPLTIPTAAGAIAVAAGDFDGDGESDLAVGNLTDDSMTVLLNRTPPDTTLTAGPSEAISSTTPEFAFAADEPGATFQCRIDAAEFAACASPATMTVGDGAHTFEVRAVDPAGNPDPTPASRAFTVDATAPNTSVDSGPAGPTNSATVSFTFSASEAGTSFECRLDGAAFGPCGSPVAFTGVNDGPHSFEVRATDAVGNVDATPAVRAFTVDTAAPDTIVDSGPSGAVANLNPTFVFHATEPGSSTQCRIDDAAFAACSSPFATPALKPGPHVFEVAATDAAGNRDLTAARRSFTALLDLTGTVGNTWKAGTTTRVVRLVANGVPAGANVEVRCSSRKRGCRFTRRTVRRNSRGVASATRLFRRTRLRPGAVVEVRVTARYAVGRVTRFKIRRNAIPRRTTLCIPFGSTRPGRC